jgi:hypothetical protein
MRTQDIEIGTYYRHKAGLMYGYAKALKIIKPMPKYKSKYMYDLTEEEKAFTEVYVKCEWTVSKNNSFGFIKYFRPCDLVKE